MRWLAGIAVVLGCGYIGIFFSGRLYRRVQQIEALESALSQLAFCTGFLALPLADALRRSASGQSGAVRRLFWQTAELLTERPGIQPGEAWEEAVRRQEPALCLKPQELEALKNFAAHLGRGDKTDILDNIRMTSARLKLAEDAARAEFARDGKMYRGLGFLAGIFIVILFM